MTDVDESMIEYPERVLDRYCRACGARPGALCISMAGNVLDRPHRTRTMTRHPSPKRKPACSPAVKRAVVRRSGGWCEACPIFDPAAPQHPGEDPHHKIPRGVGGPDTVENVLWVCRRAHRIIHDVLGARAYDLGLLVHSTKGDD